MDLMFIAMQAFTRDLKIQLALYVFSANRQIQRENTKNEERMRQIQRKQEGTKFPE